MAAREALLPPGVYFDADVIIAGCRSRFGASRALLRLSEYGLIVGCTSDLALEEAQRHLAATSPEILRQFQRALEAAFPNPGLAPRPEALVDLVGAADPKDLPHAASAIAQACKYLVTFNLRHYHLESYGPEALRPGDLLARLRLVLAQHTS